MTTLAEFMILSGGDNRSPMLDKDLYDSWKSIMELTKKYVELSATEKIQADCDVKSTNIIFQGLPSDVYALERECKLYDEFDKFSYIKGESLHQYYLRFVELINNMNIYKMTLQQFQVNTKFLNSLLPEWSKFVMDIKLIDSGLAVPVFKQGDDPIDAINKMMSFLGEQILMLLVLQEQELILQEQKEELTFNKEFKVLNEEELEFLADLGITEGPVTHTVITNNAVYQADDLDAYDCDCDDITTAKVALMANLSRYGSVVLSEVPHSKHTHNDMLNQSVQAIPYSEQTHLVNYLENEITNDSNIIPYSQYLLETQNAAVQNTNSSLQQDDMILSVFEQLSHQVTNCNKVNKDNLIANESLSVELERYKEQVKLLEERQNVDLSTREKLIIDDFEKEINSLKLTLSKQLKEKESLTTTFNVFKNESKKKEAKNIDNEIALEKKVKELDNIVYKMGQSEQAVHMLTKPQVFYDNNLKQALGFQNPFYLKKGQQIRPILYNGNVIAKETNVISFADYEETLMLEEESRSNMLLKQSDSMVLEKKINIKPINYAVLNQLSKDFKKHFVP
ncbi:hypothetical protein Tco_0158085 [Tanacetum coccineum]